MTAKERAAKILFATKEARKSFLRFTIEQERRVLDIYRHSSLNITHNIVRYSELGLIPPANWQRLLRTVQDEMNKLGEDLTGIFHNAQIEGVRFGTLNQLDSLTPIVPFDYGPELGIGFADINRQAVEMLTRRAADGLLLSERIWELTRNNLNRLKRSIGVAVATGKSATKLAKEINTYMTYTGAKGRGIYRSEFKNARRIARTECNRAYHEGQVRYMRAKKFIVAIQWHATTGACGVCAGLDKNVYKKDEVPDLQHPHCMCYLTSILDEKIFRPEAPPTLPIDKEVAVLDTLKRGELFKARHRIVTQMVEREGDFKGEAIEKITKAISPIPNRLLVQLNRNKLLITKSDVGYSSYVHPAPGIRGLGVRLANLNVYTIRHEFAHAVDDLLSRKLNGTYSFWTNNTLRDGSKLAKKRVNLFNKLTSNKKLLSRNNGTGKFVGNFIDNYESTYYGTTVSSGGREGIEFFAMNSRRYLGRKVTPSVDSLEWRQAVREYGKEIEEIMQGVWGK